MKFFLANFFKVCLCVLFCDHNTPQEPQMKIMDISSDTNHWGWPNMPVWCPKQRFLYVRQNQFSTHWKKIGHPFPMFVRTSFSVTKTLHQAQKAIKWTIKVATFAFECHKDCWWAPLMWPLEWLPTMANGTDHDFSQTSECEDYHTMSLSEVSSPPLIHWRGCQWWQIIVWHQNLHHGSALMPILISRSMTTSNHRSRELWDQMANVWSIGDNAALKNTSPTSTPNYRSTQVTLPPHTIVQMNPTPLESTGQNLHHGSALLLILISRSMTINNNRTREHCDQMATVWSIGVNAAL